MDFEVWPPRLELLGRKPTGTHSDLFQYGSGVYRPGRGSPGRAESRCPAFPSSPLVPRRRTPSRTWRWRRHRPGPCSGTSTRHWPNTTHQLYLCSFQHVTEKYHGNNKYVGPPKFMWTTCQAAAAAVDWYLLWLHARPQQQTRCSRLMLLINGTERCKDRQTDGHSTILWRLLHTMWTKKNGTVAGLTALHVNVTQYCPVALTLL